VERVSPIEIELYFRVVAEWLLRNGRAASRFVPIRLVGTFDGSTPPDLDDRILRMAAIVHVLGVQDVAAANSWPVTHTVPQTRA
jgi:hypothetical protein